MDKINKLRSLLDNEILAEFKPNLNAIEKFYTNKRKRIAFFCDYGVGNVSMELVNKVLSEDVLRPFIDLQDIYISIMQGMGKPFLVSENGDITEFDSIEKVSSEQQKYKIQTFSDSAFFTDDTIELVKLCPHEYEIEELLMFDAVIFCVSSLMPFSLDNLKILERLHSYGPKEIFLCFFQIEQIKPTEIERLYKYITAKLASALPEISFCFVSSDDEYTPYVDIIGCYGYDKVEEWIEKIAQKQINQVKRENIVNELIQNLLGTMIDSMQLKLLPLEESKAQKFEHFRTREQNVRFQQLAWEDLRIECEKRENECVQIINNELDCNAERVFDKLHLELISTQNPKEWWKNNLPLRLKMEIESISNYIDNTLQNKLRADETWLNKELLAKFKSEAINNNPKTFIDNQDISVDNVPSAEEMKDLRKFRYVSMASASALATAMYFVVGPVGAIVSAGCGILGDRMLTKEIAKQKSALETSLRTIVDETFLKMKSLIPVKVHEVYESFIDNLDIKEDGWVKAHKIDTFSCGEDAEIDNIKIIIKQLNNLR